MSVEATVRAALLDYMRENGLTQREVAGRIGMTPQQLSAWFKGNWALRLSTVERIAAGCDLVTKVVFERLPRRPSEVRLP